MRKCYIVIILIAQVWRVALLAQVATPNGTQIDYKILSEGNIAILEAQAAQWLSDRGWTDSVYRIGPATNKYNCHSYAWYKKEGGGNDYWIVSIRSATYFANGGIRLSSPTKNQC